MYFMDIMELFLHTYNSPADALDRLAGVLIIMWEVNLV